MTQTSLGESVVQKEIHAQAKNNGVAANITHTQPLWLLAEVTYRCPLHCAFCYNTTD
jgi:pyrroloquinoline quinone biosynthesis protein E